MGLGESFPKQRSPTKAVEQQENPNSTKLAKAPLGARGERQEQKIAGRACQMLLSAMVSRGEGGRGHDIVVQSRDKPLTVTHWLRTCKQIYEVRT